ncbi:hypothetical protein AB4072_16845 [Microvirga sp. 2MCAF38]|uniref:hypothetical protein n=1 Tax=Microvirga sp. 2MCAF38 TaxID=3232989 RepID=UPI003F9B6AA9
MTEREEKLKGGPSDGGLSAYEKILSNNLKDVLAELYLIDCGIFLSYVTGEKHGTIEDILNSSTELFFKEGTICYSHTAETIFDWANSPAIVLDMEFVHPSVTVFFKVILNNFRNNVSIQRILLNDPSGDAALDLKMFARALSDARIMSLSSP